MMARIHLCTRVSIHRVSRIISERPQKYARISQLLYTLDRILLDNLQRVHHVIVIFVIAQFSVELRQRSKSYVDDPYIGRNKFGQMKGENWNEKVNVKQTLSRNQMAFI